MKSRLARLWQAQQAMVLVVCTLAVVMLVVVVVWPITDLIAAHDIGRIAGPQRAFHLQTAREAVRTQLLTLGAGLFAAGALAYTARNFTLARNQVELSRRTIELTEQGQRETFELTEQGQVTDRYTRAVEQLGSDKLDVRIGGIYALERVASDSPRDHPTVMDVLAAFVREHSQELWPVAASADAPRPLPLSGTRADIQVALTVIGRRDVTHDERTIDLRNANIRYADLINANLTGVSFFNADLTGTYLAGANFYQVTISNTNLARAWLAGAILTETDLSFADLADANLTDANLARANLTAAGLVRADLTGADLGMARFTRTGEYRADLTDADFSSARLWRADLADAKLTGTKFVGADLTEARWPENVTAPEGWERDPGSGRLLRASGVIG